MSKSFFTGGAVFATANNSFPSLYNPTVVINVVGLPVKLEEIDPKDLFAIAVGLLE